MSNTNIIIHNYNGVVNIGANASIDNTKTAKNGQKTTKTAEKSIKTTKNFNENHSKFNEKMLKKEEFCKKMFILAKNNPNLKGRYVRMKNCGKVFDFSICKDCGHWIIQHAALCRDRLCPLCNWRLSLKRFSIMMKIFEQIDMSLYKPTFLTLTIKNCPAGELTATIDTMCEA